MGMGMEMISFEIRVGQIGKWNGNGNVFTLLISNESLHVIPSLDYN